jgi:Ca-activated chloride channel family protein
VGSYDIEILSVPRVYYKNIKVLQNNTTTVQIPQPGVLNFAATNSLIVSIFYMQNNRMVWVFDIDENTRSKSILMQPGNYIAVARSTGETRTIYTKNINFTVASAEVTRLTF